MSRGGHELGYDILGVLRRPHTQGLETLQTVLIINVELLECKTCVLNKVGEEGSKLHRFDHFKVIWEVLHGDA